MQRLGALLEAPLGGPGQAAQRPDSGVSPPNICRYALAIQSYHLVGQPKEIKPRKLSRTAGFKSQCTCTELMTTERLRRHLANYKCKTFGKKRGGNQNNLFVAAQIVENSILGVSLQKY